MTQSVGPYTPAAGVLGSNPAMNAAYLSPDALLAYCASQLQRIDGKIQAMVAEQTTATKLSDALGAAQAAFAKYSGGIDNRIGGKTGDDSKHADNMANKTSCIEITKQLDAAVDKLPVDDPNRARLVEIANVFRERGAMDSPGTGMVGQAEIAGFAAEMKKMSSTIESNSQMNMITIQSLMSNRSSAIQLVTNMVQGLGDSSKSIAANVGK